MCIITSQTSQCHCDASITIYVNKCLSNSYFAVYCHNFHAHTEDNDDNIGRQTGRINESVPLATSSKPLSSKYSFGLVKINQIQYIF